MNAPAPIVRIVDDDASFLTAVARMLRASGFAVKTFASAAEFLAQPELDVPGCVLVDLQMPGLSGLDLQEALAKEGHTVAGHLSQRSWRYSDHRASDAAGCGRFSDEARAEGGFARCGETRARPRCPRARRACTRWKRCVRASPRSPRANVRCCSTSCRERLNKQIAFDLGIHERTVKLHRTAITTKLGVHSAAELTKLWMEVGGLEV